LTGWAAVVVIAIILILLSTHDGKKK